MAERLRAAGPAGRLAGLGAGWRPELGAVLAERSDLGFVEVIAEFMRPGTPLPPTLTGLGVPVVPHGTRLSLGGTEPLDPSRVAWLAAVAEQLGSPLVSEHVAFVRAGGVEAGHLLGVPRTREALGVLARNIADLRAELPVPLALENAASVLAWPDDELDPATFLTELADRTGALLLVDVANLHGDALNHGVDPLRFLDALPWERVAYAHVAGGRVANGIYFDTHLHPVAPEVLALVGEAAARWSGVPAVLLERDGNYPRAPEIHAELDAVHAAALGPGPGRPAGRPPAAEFGQRPVTLRQRAVTLRETPVTLEERQVTMVADLVSGRGPGDGFDPERFEAVRGTLIDKRRAAVARCWPELAATSDFASRFAEFARTRPPAGTRADALGFAATVHDRLGPGARREVLAARLSSRRLAVIVDRVPGGRTLIGLRLPLLAPFVLPTGAAAAGGG